MSSISFDVLLIFIGVFILFILFINYDYFRRKTIHMLLSALVLITLLVLFNHVIFGNIDKQDEIKYKLIQSEYINKQTNKHSTTIAYINNDNELESMVADGIAVKETKEEPHLLIKRKHFLFLYSDTKEIYLNKY